MRKRIVWSAAILCLGCLGLNPGMSQEVVNLLENGGFEAEDMAPWTTYGGVTTEVVQDLTDASIPEAPIEGNSALHLVVDAAGANNWDIGLQNAGHVFEQGKYYTVSTWMKSSSGELTVRIKPELAADPWTGYAEAEVTLTEEWAEYSVTTPVFTEEVSPVSITYHIAFAPGDFWVDGVRFYEGDYVEPAFLNDIAASDPMPEDAATDVGRDYTVLSWTPDPLAGAHNVYLGESFADVNAADTGSGTLVAQELSDNTVALDRLALGKTYYWRVDEVNATPDKTVFQGDVWSFTVEPEFYVIPGDTIIATASSVGIDYATADKTVNGSGLNELGQHDIDLANMWVSSTTDPNIWIQYELDQIYQLHSLKIWNNNQGVEPLFGVGAKNITIETSLDGAAWTSFADVELAQAPGTPTYEGAPAIDMSGTSAQYVRINIHDNWGGIIAQAGLSEVQFGYTPVVARYEDPANGSANIPVDSQLSWRPGRLAGQHEVYFGTESDALSLLDTVTAPFVDLGSIDLQLGTTYFWRVDEVNDTTASVWAGSLWSFSTPSAITVDDFEGYTNFSPDRAFQTWLDGFGFSGDEFFPQGYEGNGTGSGVGHDIWGLNSPHYNGDIMETLISKDGRQSMPLYYENAGAVASQTDRVWAAPQDWTANGIQTLVVYFYGDPNNTGGPVFAEINGQKVTYPDNADLTDASWHQWDIDLASLGTNLSAVTSMSIGVEGAGSGMILVDAVRLYRTAPQVPEGVVFDFETDAQGWGPLKDGTAVTTSPQTHAAGGSQSLRATMDEAAHSQQQGGWSSPQVFTAADADGGLKSVTFWYRVDDPGFDGGEFVFHWIMNNQNGGGGWYGNNLPGVVIADGQWHKQAFDLTTLGAWDGVWGNETAWAFREDLVYNFEISVSPSDNTNGSHIYLDDVVFSTSPLPKIFDFEAGTQGWGPLKDGTAVTVSTETHAAGGSQSLQATIDEATHSQQEGGWASPAVFSATEAGGGLSTVSFWYRIDDPDLNAGGIVCHWIMGVEGGGGWYGGNVWGETIADGQWHQYTFDLSVMGADAGGWEGTWGDLAAWEFIDGVNYSFEISLAPTDNTNGSNIYIDDIVFE